MDTETKKKRQSCIWNRRGDCHGMVEKLTSYEQKEWGKTLPGKALESDYSIQYCTFCLMAKLVEKIEELNENLEKVSKKMQSSQY